MGGYEFQGDDRRPAQTKAIRQEENPSRGARASRASQEIREPARTARLLDVHLSESDRRVLLAHTRAGTSPHRLVVRSHIILLADEGLSAAAIAARLQLTPATVRLWCTRVLRAGIETLRRDAPGRGRRPGMSRGIVLKVLLGMRHPPMANGWTARALAGRTETSASTVCRIWKRYDLGPSSSSSDVDRVLDKLISETRGSPE